MGVSDVWVWVFEKEPVCVTVCDTVCEVVCKRVALPQSLWKAGNLGKKGLLCWCGPGCVLGLQFIQTITVYVTRDLLLGNLSPSPTLQTSLISSRATVIYTTQDILDIISSGVTNFKGSIWLSRLFRICKPKLVLMTFDDLTFVTFPGRSMFSNIKRTSSLVSWLIRVFQKTLQVLKCASCGFPWGTWGSCYKEGLGPIEQSPFIFCFPCLALLGKASFEEGICRENDLRTLSSGKNH